MPRPLPSRQPQCSGAAHLLAKVGGPARRQQRCREDQRFPTVQRSALLVIAPIPLRKLLAETPNTHDCR